MGKWQVPKRRTRHKRLHFKALTLRLISTTVRIPLDSDVNGDTFQGNLAGKQGAADNEHIFIASSDATKRMAPLLSTLMWRHQTQPIVIRRRQFFATTFVHFSHSLPQHTS
jgi:hypothetical protein